MKKSCQMLCSSSVNGVVLPARNDGTLPLCLAHSSLCVGDLCSSNITARKSMQRGYKLRYKCGVFARVLHLKTFGGLLRGGETWKALLSNYLQVLT